MVTLIWFIVIFGVVVIAHEFGHFLIAKANGIHVVEFSVGMGPNIISRKKGETIYSLKLFPIGGACMFEGEDGVVERDEVTHQIKEPGPGSFLKAKVWARIATVVAGPLFNLVLAFILSIIVANISYIRDPIASAVAEGSGAQAAGLQAGDRIISLNGERINLYQEISVYMQLTYQGGDLKVVYERDGQRYTTMLTPQYDEQYGYYLLGISNNDFAHPQGIQSLKYAWYEVRYSVKMTYTSLKMLFKGRVSRKDVAGPVGIAVNVVGATYKESRQYGWQNVLLNMLNITVMLSVNLGILNLLPVPALDGGRLVFLLLEVIRGKPVPPEKEGLVHFVGLMFFIVLMIIIFFNDLVNIFIK
ncbi:MAG: M50 family metallopeptidase [Butyrivibrio sp.]|nr:M50 family metallopeptidase [Acetatifactor muris]MCM1559083.1 M50 family metallopeptidase [Butyrivibrio sp.]